MTTPVSSSSTPMETTTTTTTTTAVMVSVDDINCKQLPIDELKQNNNDKILDSSISHHEQQQQQHGQQRRRSLSVPTVPSSPLRQQQDQKRIINDCHTPVSTNGSSGIVFHPSKNNPVKSTKKRSIVQKNGVMERDLFKDEVENRSLIVIGDVPPSTTTSSSRPVLVDKQIISSGGSSSASHPHKKAPRSNKPSNLNPNLNQQPVVDLLRLTKSFEDSQIFPPQLTLTPLSTPSKLTLPSNPRDIPSSPHRQRSTPSAPRRTPSSNTNNSSNNHPNSTNNANPIIHRSDPDRDEQSLFEQRLCEDSLGVAVRKISSSGKSQLRYVRCVAFDPPDQTMNSSVISNHSRSSFGLKLRRGKSVPKGDYQSSGPGHGHGIESLETGTMGLIAESLTKRRRALSWGNKNRVLIPLEKFVAVRKGKTTERTKRNHCPGSRLLSLIIDDSLGGSLDIETPTRLDRDKFARAFARFLSVPLETDVEGSWGDGAGGGGVSVDHLPKMKKKTNKDRMSHTAPTPDTTIKSPSSSVLSKSSTDNHTPNTANSPQNKTLLPAISPSTAGSEDLKLSFKDRPASPTPQHPGPKQKEMTVVPPQSQQKPNLSPSTSVSSLTANIDQEIVDELHQALTELRSELEASRAEAARAVKVAEQAIQSAESCTSNDWNSTVTHKAAEAAAQAQKRSAEAMARQRLAEERLASEKRSATFWRRQAERVEEEAGVLQTRVASAEVGRERMRMELDWERERRLRRENERMGYYRGADADNKSELEGVQQEKRRVEKQLETVSLDLMKRDNEVKVLQEIIFDLKNQNREIPPSPKLNSMAKKKKSLIGTLRRKSQNRKELTNSTTTVTSLPNTTTSAEPKPPLSSSSSCASSTQQQQLTLSTDQLTSLQRQTQNLKIQFQQLKNNTQKDLTQTLPALKDHLSSKLSFVLKEHENTIDQLQTKLGLESALRRKLHHEVQDLRGTVRVYCRPRPSCITSSNKKSIVETPSHDTIVLRRSDAQTPLSFEFDRVFSSSSTQREVYDEMEELCLGVLDGYIICIMAYGQTGTGKTMTLMGEQQQQQQQQQQQHSQDKTTATTSSTTTAPGVCLQAIEQLFEIANQRKERYQDTFTMTLLEVHGEKLTDLVGGTNMAIEGGIVTGATTIPKKKKSKNKDEAGILNNCVVNTNNTTGNNTKLEIRTNYDGDTVVQGLISIPLKTYSDVQSLWAECLALRAKKPNLSERERTSHVIGTIHVVSTNIATGVGTVGKLQFVDLAGGDLVPTKRASSSGTGSSSSKKGHMDQLLMSVNNNPTTTSMTANGSSSTTATTSNPTEYKFANKSLATLCEVVNARCHFARSVPYRNSTLTHLLRDCLEGDAKVLFICCVSSDEEDIQETATALRFASRMRRVQIGKATKHTVSLA